MLGIIGVRDRMIFSSIYKTEARWDFQYCMLLFLYAILSLRYTLKVIIVLKWPENLFDTLNDTRSLIFTPKRYNEHPRPSTQENPPGESRYFMSTDIEKANVTLSANQNHNYFADFLLLANVSVTKWTSHKMALFQRTSIVFGRVLFSFSDLLLLANVSVTKWNPVWNVSQLIQITIINVRS